MWRARHAAVGVGLVSFVAQPGVARADDTQATAYTVKAGDTCASLARRTYGDARLTDVIHAANPAMGPPPHHLTAGMVLLLPPRAPTTTTPDARLAFVRNRVDVFVPDPKPGRLNEPLFRGNRVGTQTASSANVLFQDETELRLGESTLIVILGGTDAAAARDGRAQQTTLVTGGLRARLGSLAGRPSSLTVTTSGAVAALGPGEVKVDVDAKNTTRLAVYQGRSALSAQKATVAVETGFGSKADEGKAPTPPRPLPSAPVWAATPARLALTGDDGLVEVRAKYAPGPGERPAQWHVQMARDDSFDALLVDARVPGDVDALDARRVGPGVYAVRVSAFDADGFEGPFGLVSRVSVVRPALTRGRGHWTEVNFEGPPVNCAVDGESASVAETLVVDTRRAHVLRCVPLGGGTDPPVELRLAADAIVPTHLVTRWTEADARNRRARLVVQVLDATGTPFDGPVLGLTPSVAGVTLGPLERAGGPGEYVVSARWGRAVDRVRVRATTAGAPPVESDELTLPDRTETALDLAVLGGVAALPGGASARVGLEAGALVPLGGGELQLAGRLGFERHSAHSDYLLTAPVTYRVGARRWPVASYVGLAPEVAVQDAPGGAQVLFDLAAIGGAELDLGFGGVFVEGGYRGTVTGSGGKGAYAPLDGALVGGGYRLVIGR